MNCNNIITVFVREDSKKFWLNGQRLGDMPKSFCGNLKWDRILWGPKAEDFKRGHPMC